MPLESWNTVLQFASAILLGLTFAIGAGAIFTSYVVGKRQEERIAIAGRDAAKALERAAKAEQRTAELNEKAEEEQLARLKIEERMEPRRINPKKWPSMVAKLSAFKGYRADLGTTVTTFEAATLMKEIEEVLIEAHWSASEMQLEANGPLSALAPGVMVRCTSDSRSKAAAVALVEILKEEKIFAFVFEGLPGATAGTSSEDTATFRLLIVVGSKP